MKKYASRSTRLTKEHVEEAKLLLSAMGIPVIQAPSEGEAQAAHIVAKGDAYAIISQDSDSLLFGATRVVRNLSVSGKRKIEMDRDQLIVLSMLVGTDYNVGGIKGIGPKKAMKLIKEIDSTEKIFEEVKWEEHFTVSWKEVYDLLHNIPVTDDYELTWTEYDKDKIRELLVDKHDFAEERVNSLFDKLDKSAKNNLQKSLFEY